MTTMPHATLLLVLLAAPAGAGPKKSPGAADPNDWPSYNRDVAGTRFNPAEKALGKGNVGRLVEKWRFPPAGSKETIGVVHATVVVNGHVYFGTETNPAFYKLAPDGTVKWVYRNPDHDKGAITA